VTCCLSNVCGADVWELAHRAQFGFYPLYVRQPDDLTPLFQNAGIFTTIFALTWLTPLLGEVALPFAAKGHEDAPPPPPAANKPSQPAARDDDVVDDCEQPPAAEDSKSP
jgi:hypothetical protein